MTTSRQAAARNARSCMLAVNDAFVDTLSVGEHNGALNDMHLTTDPFTGNRYTFAAGNPITNIELDGHMFPGSGGGLPASPVTVVGTVFFPSSYRHLHQIQNIYSQVYQGGIRQNVWNTSPQSKYRALFVACATHQDVCGGTLMNALWHGGQYGTAMTKQNG